jgi:hypothetical protein
VSFTTTVTTDRGKVRLLISDTNTSYPIFDDDQIDAFLTLSGSDLFLAASYACTSMATEATRGAVSYNILASNISVDAKQLPAYYLALAEKYKQNSKDQVGFSLDEIPLFIENFSGIDRSNYSQDAEADQYLLADYEKNGRGS